MYSDYRVDYVSFYFFLLGKHVAIQNYSLEIHVYTESRPRCIQNTGGIMSIFIFFCYGKHVAIQNYSFSFLLRAAPGVFRLQGELCVFFC